MDELQIRILLEAYHSWAKALCAPVFWRDADARMRNGTITFVRTHTDVLGVTNAHVAEGIATCTDEPGKGCQVGGADLDPARFIARHPT